MTYVWSLDKIFVLQSRHTSLPPLLVHLLKLRHGVFLDMALNHLDNILVIRQVRSMTLEPNHVQRCTSFQRAVDVVVFFRVLRFVQIS